MVALVLPAVIAGVAMALAVYAGATALWGHTVSNRFASIALSYSNAPASPSDGDRLNYFIIFAVIGNALQPDRRRGAVSRHRPRECRRGPRLGEALAYKGRVSGTNTTAAPQHQGAISRQR